jgi:hypothetical protein
MFNLNFEKLTQSHRYMVLNLVRIVHNLANVQSAETRAEALQSARNWLQEHSYKDLVQQQIELEFAQLWQGIFYFYWLTDKELPQHDAAHKIASMIHLIDNEKALIIWLKTFFEHLHKTWIKLDKHRMSKYYSLVRYVFQDTFQELSNRKYARSLVTKFVALLKNGPFSEKEQLLNSLQIHIVELFILELKQFGSENLDEDTFHILIDLFLEKFAKSIDTSLCKAIVENIFEPLAIELDLTLEDFKEEIEAEGESLEGDEKPELVVLPVNHKRLADALFKYGSQKKAVNREECYSWKQQFEQIYDEKHGKSAEDLLEAQEKELEALQSNSVKHNNATVQKKEKKEKKSEQSKKKENNSETSQEKALVLSNQVVTKTESKKEEDNVEDLVTPTAQRLANGEPLTSDEDEEGDWEDIDDDEDEDVFGFNVFDGFDIEDMDDEFDDDDSYLVGDEYDDEDAYQDDEDDVQEYSFYDQDDEDDQDEKILSAFELFRQNRRRQKRKSQLRLLEKLKRKTPTKSQKQESQIVASDEKSATSANTESTGTSSDEKRRVSFSLKDNKIKVFDKAHVVAKSPISQQSPSKGLLKKRKADEMISNGKTKLKNPPLIPQQAQKKRRKK